MMNHGEKLGKLIFLERGLENESTKSKITEFRSRFAQKSSMNKRVISEIENREKPKLKLKLTKITIQNQNLKLYEGRLR